ncbi:MAG: hypothetical protein GX817_06350 [Elusimicrobia bacterium]|nr:hypothetical protein [Elusimicrobiota bacterium]
MTKKNLIISGALLLFFITIFTGWRILISFSEDLPSTSSLLQYRPSLVTEVYDVHGELIDELFMERRTLVPLRNIPMDLQNAIIAIEDTNFFNHWGMDLGGIIRAVTRNIGAGQVVQGGSTITQQLAKVLFLTPEKKYSRKIKELLLAMHMEREFSKEEILQFYLNQIYFGAGSYGVQSAARLYFNKPVEDLNLSECAMLAGLPRAPNAYSPARNLLRAYRRRAVVLKRMESLNFISEEERLEAERQRLPFVTYARKAKPGAYFVEHIRKRLLPEFGANILYKGGLRIYTTLDLSMQKIAEEVLTEHLERYDEVRTEEIFREYAQEH